MKRSGSDARPGRTARAIAAIVAFAAGLYAPVAARAEEDAAPSGNIAAYVLEDGETRFGDSYLVTRRVAIDGTHRGDLNGFANSIRISGVLTGDLQFGAQNVTIDGTIEDSVRLVAQSAHINGLIDGDLVVIAGTLVLGPEAHVTGRLAAVVQQMTMDGAVDGPLFATGGEVSIAGTAGQNVEIRAESVTFSPSATIGGDLDYSAREELAPDARPVVAGSVRYEQLEHDEEKDESSGFRLGAVLWWGWSVCAAFVVGLVALSLFRNATTQITATVSDEWALSLGLGFITFIVAPVAGLLACFLIVTIPLVFLAFLLYVALIYVAKLPVALWAGNRILRLLGRPMPSPVASLAIGIPLLFALFQIPVLGFLLKVACMCIGLGAIALGTRQHLRSRRPLVAAS